MPAESDTRRAVVDSIAEGQAVLLVGPGQQEYHVAADSLPDGTGEGAWLIVTGADDGLRVVGTDHEGEATRRGEMDARVERLRRTRRGGRFGR